MPSKIDRILPDFIYDFNLITPNDQALEFDTGMYTN